ncbi:putative S-locus lectin protein kinase family protein [Hibiscus syriacus]|uniref:S-locus lectin protein kinase family protein n=1 Tax=Hibiscus syriacus TaxID=106335 RepID=A0A6A3CR73_HIBSY|nr:putative S-locus lectin protein kinase family protein [Hibiscus syriacus]
MLTELAAYYQIQSAAVDVETVLEKQTIERLIELELDGKPARFTAHLLQIFTSNHSTKLGQGGCGSVFNPDGRPIAVKPLNSRGIDKRIEEQFMAEIYTTPRIQPCRESEGLPVMPPPRFGRHFRGKRSAVCGPHLQASAVEEVDQKFAVCKKKTACIKLSLNNKTRTTMSTSDNSDGQLTQQLEIVFGTIGGVAGLLIIACIIIKLKKPENKDKELQIAKTELQPAPPVDAEVDVEAVSEKQTIERLIELVLDEKPARFSGQLLQVFTSNYSTKLGQGGYGSVFRGHFPDGRTYHRNLVRLYGFCFEPETKAIVYEYMENGSLDKLLFDKKHEIEWDKLYEIAVGAARGLEYLHHFSLKKIIHYDIKPANVLLDSNFCPKIADFGLAKLCNRDTTNITMSKVGGTPGYAAPEIWMPFPVSYKCDVYSFGAMLFEIVGRRRNFLVERLDWFPKQVWENFDKGELDELWDKCEIEEKDREKAKTMVTVALWCVQYLPEARPSMRNVVKILEGGAEADTPPNPFQHLISSANVHSYTGSGSNSTTDYDEDDIMIKYEIHHATC